MGRAASVSPVQAGEDGRNHTTEMGFLFTVRRKDGTRSRMEHPRGNIYMLKKKGCTQSTMGIRNKNIIKNVLNLMDLQQVLINLRIPRSK